MTKTFKVRVAVTKYFNVYQEGTDIKNAIDSITGRIEEEEEEEEVTVSCIDVKTLASDEVQEVHMGGTEVHSPIC